MTSTHAKTIKNLRSYIKFMHDMLFLGITHINGITEPTLILHALISIQLTKEKGEKVHKT